MEPTYFTQLIRFIKSGFEERVVFAFKGMLYGLIGSLGILWNGSGAETVVMYVIKGVGTVILTIATTTITLYITYRFEKWKDEKEKKSPSPKKRKNNRAA